MHSVHGHPARGGRPVAAALLALAALGAFAGCRSKEPAAAAPVVKPVKTATVRGFELPPMEFPASIDAGRKLIVSFRVPGRLVELPVRKGQAVAQGDLIARLDPRDFEIAVEEARANWQKATADYERYKTLYEKNAVPLADLDQRRSQRDVAQARLDEARRNLGYATVTAPFAGIIGNRYVENYMDVRAQQEIVDLNDTTTVEVRVDASEMVIATLRRFRDALDLHMNADFDAAPGREYPVTVKEIATRADPQTQTFQVVFAMPQPRDITLLPGMTGRVRITAQPRPGAELARQVTVPAIAVETDPAGAGVAWVVDPATMTVHRRQVAIGGMQGDADVLVRDGLAPGDVVVTAGLAQLSEGMQVRFWDEQEK
ncbi:MAG TPA: efflux RND transporter periplasmic adaptor subunit [Candidatus Krumholzibacteria bacterium]|nr:efflux RND transporter periplasmic adaptor subunit [Candidatus Krumholzibacteria bacterium]